MHLGVYDALLVLILILVLVLNLFFIPLVYRMGLIWHNTFHYYNQLLLYMFFKYEFETVNQLVLKNEIVNGLNFFLKDLCRISQPFLLINNPTNCSLPSLFYMWLELNDLRHWHILHFVFLQVGTAMTNAFINAKKAVNKTSEGEIENVPVLSTSAAYGVYMAVSSNLR